MNVHCDKYKYDISKQICISRQKILAQNFDKIQNINRRKQYEVCAEDCLNCNAGLKLYKESLNTKKGEVIMATKICKKCKKEFPVNSEYFYRHKSTKDGFYPWCKACHNKSSNKTTPGKEKLLWQSDREKPQEPDQKQLNEKRHKALCDLQEKEPEKKCGNVIELDFSKYPELFEKIKQWAEGELRTVENQILYHIIHKGLL